MLTNDFQIVVLIATSGRNILLGKSLNSLSEIAIPSSLIKVIIVENGRKFEAEKIVGSFKDLLPLEYRYSTKANKSAALNLAIKDIADDVLIFFTDDDVEFTPNTLMDYEKAVKLLGFGHFFGGPLKVKYEDEPTHYLKELLPPSSVGWKADRETCPRRFLGINWAAFAKDIKTVGYFNENVGPGASSGATGQEHDMQDRLYNTGIIPVYLPEAYVYHYVPKSRSSERWVIHRKYRKGINNGLKKGIEGYRKKVFGIPLHVVLNFVKSLLLLLKFRHLLNPKLRLGIFCKVGYQAGMIKGLLLRRKTTS